MKTFLPAAPVAVCQGDAAMHLVFIGLEWKSSASRNSRPNLLATAAATSDLPEPDTPVRTIATAFFKGVSIVVILKLGFDLILAGRT